MKWQLSICVLLLCAVGTHAESVADRQRVDYARDVKPILESSCFKCHGPDKQKGGVRLDRPNDALAKGDSGVAAISPGQAEQSELVRRIESADPDERMPPKADPLTPQQIATLRAWIDDRSNWSAPQSVDAAPPKSSGAMIVTEADRQHWSFLPLTGAEVPSTGNAGWGSTPIDRFVLGALEAAGLQPNALADRRTLIRRVYFDLHGLPPTPEEVDAFVADESPDAYEELIERLLGSPHYGERWGRHWLDLARYADSDGLETDADRPDAWHYRDFVIRALNDDLPYQAFVRWQLAGDEYEPDNPQALSATGFLTGAPTEFLGPKLLEEERLRLRYNELDDMAATTVSAFLGLTLGCARCHDHKYDAIPTRDYYRLQCAFTTTSRDNVLLTTRAEAARYRISHAQWKKRCDAAEERLNAWLSPQKERHTAALRNARIGALQIDEDQKRLLKEQPDSAAAKSLAKQHRAALKIVDEDYRRVLSEDERAQWDVLRSEVERVRASQPDSPPTALAIRETQSEPQPTWLLERGDFHTKSSPVQLGFLSVLTPSKSADEYWAEARRSTPAPSTTLQRRAMAEWLTDPEYGAGALLARVFVNRVWQHHFGEGLVRTVSDFGVRGEAPTHPELLEWLTREFVAGGWRLKPLHRLILTSSAYRQGDAYDAGRAQLDPDNRLLWRRRPQRLEAEALRDAILAVSGTLNAEPFGPAFKPPIPAEAMTARNTKNPYPLDARDTPATRRRSVYMFHKRVVQHPLLTAFDRPDSSVSCGRRDSTTVAPQALALLNDPFVRDRAADFARRLLADCGENPADWTSRAYRLALSRDPTQNERAASLRFLDEQVARRRGRDASRPVEDIRLEALADYCQAIFSLNEFIYVD